MNDSRAIVDDLMTRYPKVMNLYLKLLESVRICFKNGMVDGPVAHAC